MRVEAVGRRSFITAFQLIGLHGIEVESSLDALKSITQLMGEKDVGLVIVSEDLTRPHRRQVNEMRSKQPTPLIYEVPAPGSKYEKMEYREVLKQILGV